MPLIPELIRNEGITGTGLFTGDMALKGTKGHRKALKGQQIIGGGVSPCNIR